MIANLPYYITGALLTRFMQAPNIVSATVLVQKEVALRLSARPGEDGYGYSRALAALYGSAKLCATCPKARSFPPRR